MMPSTPDAIVRALLDVTPRVSLLVLATALLVRLLRSRANGSTQNAIWSVALIGIGVLPIATSLLPAWEPHVLPPPASQPRFVPAFGLRTATSDDPRETPPAPDASPGTVRATRRAVNGPAFVVVLWVLGVLAVSGAQLRGLSSLRRVTSGPSPSRRLRDRLEEERCRAGIRRRVRLLVTAGPVPMTWGHRRPVIAIPAAAETWSESCVCHVFRHELAHIRRRDFAGQFLARATCAFHWFNPLVWAAAYAWRTTCERACDESVVESGTRATEYAETLLSIASTVPTPSRSLAALSMVKSPNLEDRIMSILHARRSVGPACVAGPALIAVFVASVAATSPARRTAPPSPPSPPTPPTAPTAPTPRLFAQLGTDGSGLSYRYLSDDHRIMDLTDRKIGLRIQLDGRVDIEDGRIVSIDEDSEVYVTARRNGTRVRARIVGDEQDKPVIEWYVGGDKVAVDDDAREWIRAALAIAELHMERSSLVAHRDGLRAEIDGVHAERDGIEAQIDGVHARRDGLLARIDGAHASRDGLEAEIAGVYAERDGLRAALNRLDMERDHAKDRVLRLRDRDADAERIARAEDTVAEIETEIRELRERIAQTNTDDRVAAIRRHIDELRTEEEAAAIRDRVEDLDVSGRTEELRRRIEALRVDEHVEQLESEIASLDAEHRVDAIRRELDRRYVEFDAITERLTNP